jgi:phosphoribosyl 1,2-cyclic phosphodiesterase
VRVQLWGTRGSLAAPGAETARYGGNTACVEVRGQEGTVLVLDAGTGIRGLGMALVASKEAVRVEILLTHLHLDHIQGLMFFAPCFSPDSEVVIWGPASPEASLEDRIARYISAPLTPIEVRELPCGVSFRDCPTTEWEIGSARLHAATVTHRGPTLGYRISEHGRSVCYIPDHELGLGGPLAELEPEWISGFDLAEGATLLLHDSQYTDAEYPEHIGWGHSCIRDALSFARRTGAQRTLLFHHDPLRSDDRLDELLTDARARWRDLGGADDALDAAVENAEIELVAQRATASA